MTALHLLAAIAVISLPALAQAPASQPLLHLSTSFDFVVHAPFAKAAPLFGPEGERAWAGKHWNPEFVHPQPARDVEGAVFTIQHGAMKAVWVNTLFDLESGRYQYVYFLPDIMVTVIDVRLKADGANTTRVNVVYTRTALTAEGNEHVTAMNEADKTAGKEWEQSINDSLATGKISPTP
jgi:hypothetical protein